jgi:hypothetical protein
VEGFHAIGMPGTAEDRAGEHIFASLSIFVEVHSFLITCRAFIYPTKD